MPQQQKSAQAMAVRNAEVQRIWRALLETIKGKFVGLHGAKSEAEMLEWTCNFLLTNEDTATANHFQHLAGAIYRARDLLETLEKVQAEASRMATNAAVKASARRRPSPKCEGRAR